MSNAVKLSPEVLFAGLLEVADYIGPICLSKMHNAMQEQLSREQEAEASSLRDQLVSALRDVTDVLDAFGDMSDALIDPNLWKGHQAEEKIKAARAALAAAEAQP